MFLHLSVILSTGEGVSAPVHAGIHPLGRHPLGRHPLQQATTAADGTHPTGMHSCFLLIHVSGGSKGGAPKTQNFLNLMQSFWKIWQNRMLPPPEGWRPLLRANPESAPAWGEK